jgi:RNA polymerase sigma factor (sigma-70 family)
MKKDWVLSQNEFDAMLAWLDPDWERAGTKYENIRVRLIKILTCRGCPSAEELADETINRVASKVPEIAGTWEGDPSLYFYKVAQNIFLEWRRVTIRQVDVPVEEAQSVPAVAAASDEVAEHDCLDQCLKELEEGERNLMLEYYRQQGQAKIDHRKKLATEMGIAVNALRIRAHRIRRSLRKCVVDCLEAQPVN